MSEAQKNKGQNDESLNVIDSSYDELDYEKNSNEENSPKQKQNRDSIQNIALIDENGNQIVNKISRSQNGSALKTKPQPVSFDQTGQENLKSQLKEIQNKLDEIKASYPLENLRNELKQAKNKLDKIKDMNPLDKANYEEKKAKYAKKYEEFAIKYQEQLKEAVPKLNELIKLQNDRQVLTTEDAIQSVNVPNEVQLKFAQDPNSLSASKSQKNAQQQLKDQSTALKQVQSFVENEIQTAKDKVTDGLNNIFQLNKDDGQKEQKEQDEIWKGIMDRSLKGSEFVKKDTITKLTYEELKNLEPANIDDLESSESYYESLEKDGVMFELHEFHGYIHLAQIISFKSKTDYFHLIKKYSLDLNDTVFKPVGCFAIQTHINYKFNSLSIIMRGSATYFFKLNEEQGQFYLCLYQHTENDNNGEGQQVVDVTQSSEAGVNYKIELKPDQPFKVEFMLDLSDSKRMNEKQEDFLASQFISVTQFVKIKNETQKTQVKDKNQDESEQVPVGASLDDDQNKTQRDKVKVEIQPDKTKVQLQLKDKIQLKVYKIKEDKDNKDSFQFQEFLYQKKLIENLDEKQNKRGGNETNQEFKPVEPKKLTFEENLDNVGFFRNINQKTKFFLYFKNKHQTFIDFNEKQNEIDNEFHESSVQGTDSQFFECNFKRWQAQSFVVKTEKIKKNDEEIQVELIYFLLLNNKATIREVQKDNGTKEKVAFQGICQFYLCDTKDPKKLKKVSDAFLKQQISKRQQAQKLINERVEQLKGTNYFLLDSQKVIVFTEDEIEMLYLEDFSTLKSNSKDNEPNLNNVFLYDTRANKRDFSYSNYGAQDYKTPQRHSLFLHRNKQKVIYGLHQIFIDCNERVQSIQPTLEISKEWMFIDLHGEAHISIIYLGEQRDQEYFEEKFFFQYHVSKFFLEKNYKTYSMVTFFYYEKNEVKFTQQYIDKVIQSSVDENDKNSFDKDKLNPLELEQGHDLTLDDENSKFQAEDEQNAPLSTPKANNKQKNLESHKLDQKKKFQAREIQFEQVTDLAKTEVQHIKFIAYCSDEKGESQGLGTPYFCRASAQFFYEKIFQPDQYSGKNNNKANNTIVRELIYKKIPMDFDILNKEFPGRNTALTLLFASCSSFKQNVNASVQQSFQIGFTHYDDNKKIFLDCVDIYEYQVEFKTQSLDFKIQKSYLIVQHEQIHQNVNDGSEKVIQRKAIVPIIDSNGEPRENQVLFLGQKNQEKQENNQEEDENGNDYQEDQDNGIDYYNEEQNEAENQSQNEYEYLGGEKSEFEGGIVDEKLLNFLVPLDQNNCNQYSTRIISASYKHFGLQSRAQLSVLASNIQQLLLENGAFSELEKLYLLNQELKNLLQMSEPTFAELFGEINQETSDFICQSFQPKFIKKGLNNFAINLKSKKFDQSNFNKIFKQLKDFVKLKQFIPTNSIISRTFSQKHLAEIFDINILFDLQAGFNHQSLIEWAFQYKQNAILVELVRFIQRNNIRSLDRKKILMADLPQLISDQKVSIKEFLNRKMTPLLEEEEDSAINIAELLEDPLLPTISDKNRQYFEISSLGFDEQTEITKQVKLKLKDDQDEAEEVNFIYIDFFMTTLKLKIDVIKGREKADSTDYLKFFDNVAYQNVNCNEIFIAGLICQREDEEIYNYNIIQKFIERQQNKFSSFGNKILWFFYVIGFYVPYVTTILLRYTYRNDFKGISQNYDDWKVPEGKEHARATVYVFRAFCLFTQFFYFCFELEELSFSGYSYFQSVFNIADFTQPFIFLIHVILSSISLEWDNTNLNVIDCVNSYLEVFIIMASSVKFLNLAKSFNDYQMLVEMLFTVIRQIIPLLLIYLFSLQAVALSQMATLATYNLEYEDKNDEVNNSTDLKEPGQDYSMYPKEYPLIPKIGSIFLQTLRNSVGDYKSPLPGLWEKNNKWNISQSFGYFLSWAIYILAIFLINIIVLNFLIIWVGEIYSTVKGGIPYYFRMQAEMNFNYLKSTRHLIQSQNKYNQIWVIKSPIKGLPDNVATDKMEDLENNITKMQLKIKDKLQKKMEDYKKEMDQNLESIKQEMNQTKEEMNQKLDQILYYMQYHINQ